MHAARECGRRHTTARLVARRRALFRGRQHELVEASGVDFRPAEDRETPTALRLLTAEAAAIPFWCGRHEKNAPERAGVDEQEDLSSSRYGAHEFHTT